MSAFDDVLGEVFGLFDVRDPPLGSSGLRLDQVFIGKLEEVALGVVARVDGENLETCGLGAYLGEEVLAVTVAVVVLGSGEGGLNCVVVVLEELGLVCIGRVSTLATVFPEEDVVLQDHAVGNAHGEDAAVVSVIHGGDVLHGVVLEVDGADLDGVGSIDTEERADTVPHGVVLEDDILDFRTLADIEGVAAGADDAVHVAGVEDEFTDLEHGVVVSVEETAQEVGDFAVDELDAGHFEGSAGMVHDTGAVVTVELDVLEVEVGIILGKVGGEFKHTHNHGLFTVRAKFAHDGEAAHGLCCSHAHGSVAVGEIVLTSGQYGGLEFGLGGDDSLGSGGCHGPYVYCTAGGAEVEEGDLVFGGSLKAVDRERCIVLCSIVKVLGDG